MQWFVQPAEDTDVYIITAGASPPSPGAPGFQRDIENAPQDVLNGLLPGEWQIVPAERLDGVFQSAPFSASPVYSTNQFQSVQPVNNAIGVEELLSTSGDKVNPFPLRMRMTRLSVSMQVIIQIYPIGLPSAAKPSWNFTPVLD